jgi:hypothetical protein
MTPILFIHQDAHRAPLKDIPLQELGVGGLDCAFVDIFRRAFSSRCLNPETAQKWGIPHTKGLLLYGPPGTGKTLLAKTIAKMLNSTNVTKITGSDILSKWVGEAERQLRELFQPAEDEWARKGIYRYTTDCVLCDCFVCFVCLFAFLCQFVSSFVFSIQLFTL